MYTRNQWVLFELELGAVVRRAGVLPDTAVRRSAKDSSLDFQDSPAASWRCQQAQLLSGCIPCVSAGAKEGRLASFI